MDSEEVADIPSIGQPSVEQVQAQEPCAKCQNSRPLMFAALILLAFCAGIMGLYILINRHSHGKPDSGAGSEPAKA